MRHLGHVYVDGGSTAKGYCDDLGLGFAGRMEFAYKSYNDLRVDQDCRRVFFDNRSQVDRNTVTMAEAIVNGARRDPNALVGDNLTSLARIRNMPFYKVGIFVVGMWPYRGRGSPENSCEEVWRDSLEKLSEAHGILGQRTLVINVLRPNEGVRNGFGQEISLSLFDTLAEMTRAHVETWEEADYLTIEDIISVQGDDSVRCIAPDGRHPNARGHAQIARFLIKHTNAIFGIPDDLVPPVTLPDLSSISV